MCSLPSSTSLSARSRQAASSGSGSRRRRSPTRALGSHARCSTCCSRLRCGTTRSPETRSRELRRCRGERGTPRALTLDQVAAIRAAAAIWRTEPGLLGPRPDGQVRDIIEILLGTAMRVGEVLGLRIRDVTDGPRGMVVSVNATVVQRKGKGTFRQERPKSDASIRRIPVPEFAADVVATLGEPALLRPGAHALRQPERRTTQPLQRPPNVPEVPRAG